MLFHIRRSPDEEGGGEAPPEPEGAPERKPEETLEHWRKRAEAHHADLKALKAEAEELRAFKAAQESEAEAARQADLEAKGEFAKLREEWEAREADYQAKLDGYAKADAERAKATAAKVDAALEGRTDADEMRGKLIRLVGDDPHRQWDLLQELTGTSGAGSAPATGTPDLRGGQGEPGEADLSEAEREKCRIIAAQIGRPYEEHVKRYIAEKARIAALPPSPAYEQKGSPNE